MIYKTKVFQSIFKKSRIRDEQLLEACHEMDQGLFEAELGNHLYKKRVAIPGQGKSGGYRTMVGAVIGNRYFFLYMFAKSDRANISKREELALKELAKQFIDFDQAMIEHLVNEGELIKVEDKP